MSKRYEDLKFSDNFMFVKIMGLYPELCRELLELILNTKISRLEPIIPENTVQPAYESHGIRYDVYTQDASGTRFDVEMQASTDPDIEKRSRYYHSTMDIEQLMKGMDYSELKPSFVIFICKEKIADGYDLPIYTFRNQSREDPGKCLGDETYTVFVNAQYSEGSASKEMEDFLRFVRTGKADSDGTGIAGRLHDAVAETIRTGKWSVDYMRWEDELKHIGFVERKKGRAEGRAEGDEARALSCIRSLMESQAWSADQAMDALNIPEEDREKFLKAEAMHV